MSDSKEQKGKILLIIGAFLVVVALTADVIGAGTKPGFGWKQGLLLIVGLGIAWMGKKSCQCGSEKSLHSEEEKKSPPESNQV